MLKTDTSHATRIARIFFAVVFALAYLYTLLLYLSYKKIVDTKQNVAYQYIDKEIHSGGRGSYYVMHANYNDRLYTVHVTSSTYYAMDWGVYPDLYYLPLIDSLFTEWQVRVCFKLFWVFLAGFVITIIPYGDFFKQKKL